MWRFLSALMLVLCGFLSGCALVESLVGVKRDPKTGAVQSDGTGGVAGSILNIVVPGAGAVLAAAAAAYANARSGKWKKAFISTAEAVEAWKETEEGKAQWESLRKKLGDHHAAQAIQGFVDKVLTKQAINKL